MATPEATTVERLHTEHEAIVEAIREVVREENGLKKWAAAVAVSVSAAAVIGALSVWRTQAVVEARLTVVEHAVVTMQGDVRSIRDSVIKDGHSHD